MIKIKQGNIIDALQNGEVQYIAHQVNCVGGYNAGLHGKLAKIYPKLIDLAKDTNGTLKYFGKSKKCFINRNISIYNLYSQYYVSKPSNKFVNNSLIQDNYLTRLKALKNALNDMCEDIIVWIDDENISKIGLPLLASGLARQDGYEKMTDLEYFIEHIYPTVEEVFIKYPILNVIIYHL